MYAGFYIVPDICFQKIDDCPWYECPTCKKNIFVDLFHTLEKAGYNELAMEEINNPRSCIYNINIYGQWINDHCPKCNENIQYQLYFSLKYQTKNLWLYKTKPNCDYFQ